MKSQRVDGHTVYIYIVLLTAFTARAHRVNVDQSPSRVAHLTSETEKKKIKIRVFKAAGSTGHENG